MRTGTRLFSYDPPWDSPSTYTRCQESLVDGDRLIVGGFSPSGLVVDGFPIDKDTVGVAALRKLLGH